jgi:hypothetical protein
VRAGSAARVPCRDLGGFLEAPIAAAVRGRPPRLRGHVIEQAAVPVPDQAANFFVFWAGSKHAALIQIAYRAVHCSCRLFRRKAGLKIVFHVASLYSGHANDKR